MGRIATWGKAAWRTCLDPLARHAERLALLTLIQQFALVLGEMN